MNYTWQAIGKPGFELQGPFFEVDRRGVRVDYAECAEGGLTTSCEEFVDIVRALA